MTSETRPERNRNTRIILNTLIAVGAATVVYLLIAPALRPPAATETKTAKIIQLDVLNGCGAKGVGARFTGYLRQSGFDVVEMKNYKTSNIARTLVIDRVGDLAAARRVAASLGVSEHNVIQQLNPDYFVDVSVVIGEDYQSLRPGH
jgi:hypothetical protein